MPQPTQAQYSNKEDRILQAIQAIKNGHLKSIRQAAESFDVTRRTLSNRMNGMTSRRDSTPNSQKLTSYEEAALVQYILDLDSQDFHPGHKLCKKWQTFYSPNEARALLGRTGLQTS